MKQKLLYLLVGLIVGAALLGLWRSSTFVNSTPSPVYDRLKAVYPDLSQHDLAVIREAARRAHVLPVAVVETVIRHPVVPNDRCVEYLRATLTPEKFEKEMARFARISVIQRYFDFHPGTSRKLCRLSAEDFKSKMAFRNSVVCDVSASP